MNHFTFPSLLSASLFQLNANRPLFFPPVARLNGDNGLYLSTPFDNVTPHTSLPSMCFLLLSTLLYCFLFYTYFRFTLQARIDQWIDFSALEIDANILKLYLPRLGFAPYLPPVSLFPYYIPFYFLRSACNSFQAPIFL